MSGLTFHFGRLVQMNARADAWLYLKGVSTGDFSEALAALLGPDAKGLSATTVTRLMGITAYVFLA